MGFVIEAAFWQGEEMSEIEMLQNRGLATWVRDRSFFGLFTTDTRLIVTEWNLWLESLSGWTRQEVIGTHLLDLYPDLVTRKVDRYFREALEGRSAVLSHTFHGYLLPMQTDAGGDPPVNMPQKATISPLILGGQISGTVGCIEDVTERVRREKELIGRVDEEKRLVEELKSSEEALREKEEKLRNIRDELEKHVDERTRMLKETNVRLTREIEDHEVTEDALQQSEKRLRGLSRRLLRSQEEERRLIAMELHDGIGQTLSAIKFKVENGLQELSGKSPEECFELQGPVVSMLQEAVEEVRRICKNLRPPILDDLGIVATISWFCREFENVYGNIRVEKEILLDEKAVSGEFKTSIFRVLQEAFNNIAKHSGADRVRVVLKKDDKRIVLLVEDNGRGFDVAAVQGSKDPADGMGLAGMKERTTLSGGSFEIESVPGEGARIRASFP